MLFKLTHIVTVNRLTSQISYETISVYVYMPNNVFPLT